MTEKIGIPSEQLFRVLIEQSTDAITLIAPDGTILYANPSAGRLADCAPEKLAGVNYFTLVHSDDQEPLRDHLKGLIEHPEEPLALTYRARLNDGTWQWLEGTALNLLAHPQVGAILCTTRRAIRRPSHLVQGQSVNQAEEEAAYQFEQQFSSAMDKFHPLLKSDIVGIMVTDQQGKIYEVNDRLVHLLGYSQEELLGKMHVKDMLLPAYQSVRTRSWRALRSQGASLPEKKEYRRKDGSVLSCLVAKIALSQERNRALEMLLDSSDWKEAEQHKQEFLSMVSHELRTPLTIVQGFLELGLFWLESFAEAPSVAREELQKLEAMLQQALRQIELEARLVKELADVSRMEMQKFKVVLQPCNLIALVRQVIAGQQQTTHPVELVLPPQEVVLVMADADRVEQVLTNYLTNAFKYSPAGLAIRVEVNVEDLMVRVFVSDQGPGLAVEEQRRIWDRFYQAKTIRAQDSEVGLGLGLYIVRTIIAQHQGQVGVESHPHQGATFWFRLPLADKPAPE